MHDGNPDRRYGKPANGGPGASNRPHSPRGYAMRFALSTVVFVAAAMTLEVSALPVQQSPQRPPVFTATANFVQSDVVVRDNRGRLVSGLTAADFVIYE